MLPTACLLGIGLTAVAASSDVGLPSVGTEIRRFHTGHRPEWFAICGHALTATSDGTRLLAVGNERATVWTADGTRVVRFDSLDRAGLRPAGFTPARNQVFAVDGPGVHARWNDSAGKWYTQMRAGDEIRQRFAGWVYRWFRPARQPGEADRDFNHREMSFGMALGLADAVLFPWVSATLAVTPDGRRQVVATMGNGFGISESNILLIQVWDTEQQRAVRVFSPPSWPLALYAVCQILDHMEGTYRPHIEWVMCVGSSILSRGPQPANETSPDVPIAAPVKSGSRWFDRIIRALASPGSRPPLIDHLLVSGIGHAVPVFSSPAISHNGEYLAACAGDSSVRVWSLDTGSQVRRLPTGRAVAITFDPTGKTVLVAEAGDGGQTILSRWDVPSGRRLWKTMARCKGIVSIRTSPDGRLALLIGQFGGAAVLWDVEAGKPLGRLGSPKPVVQLTPAEEDSVCGAAFLGTGRRVATVNDDGMIQVWQLPKE